MRYLNGQKTQILIAHQKQGIDWTKKVQIAAKKSSARDKRILPLGTWHLALGTNSYCSSEGKNGPDKKSTASSQKKFG